MRPEILGDWRVRAPDYAYLRSHRSLLVAGICTVFRWQWGRCLMLLGSKMTGSLGPGPGAVTITEIICLLVFNDEFKNIHLINHVGKNSLCKCETVKVNPWVLFFENVSLQVPYLSPS